MKASDWINTNDRLPKKGTRVFVCRTLFDGTSNVDIATYMGRDNIRNICHWYLDDGFDIDEVTHWQNIVLPKMK